MQDLYVFNTGPYYVNTYIIPLAENVCFVVDPAGCSLCKDEKLLDRYLKKREQKLFAIVLTHGHFDHITGLPHLKKVFPNVPILIHSKDAVFLCKEGINLQKQTLVQMGQDEIAPALDNMPQADCFLEDSKTLLDCLQGYTNAFFEKNCSDTAQIKQALKQWCIIHTPGHTPGSVCLHNKEKGMLLSGDTLFYHSYGRTDLPYGNENDILKSLEYITKTIPKNTKIYPGHGIMDFLL